MLQEAALGVVTAPGWPRHLHRARHTLADRLAAAANEVARLPGVELVGPPGGYLLWLRLAQGTDDVGLTRRAREAGVLVSPGRRWAVSEPDNPYLRLSVAAIAVGEIPEAFARLASILG